MWISVAASGLMRTAEQCGNQRRQAEAFAVENDAHAEVEVLAVAPSKSKVDRGIAHLRYTMLNQRLEAVAGFIVNHLLLRRPAA